MITTIHQTSKTKDLNRFQQECSDNIRSIHSSSKYKLWDDNDLLSIVKTEFPDLADIWQDIEGIQRADLGRYAVLFIEGGLYADTDVIFNKNFFTNMNLNSDQILLAPSVKVFPWSSNSLTNYVIYAPRTKMAFFKTLVEEGTNRIKKTTNKNFVEYVPYTTGRVLVNDIAKNYNVSMISENNIKNKFCGYTDTENSICYHEGSTIRNAEDGSWRGSTVMGIVNTECNLREKINVEGNICQVPILLITILVFGILVLYFYFKKR